MTFILGSSKLGYDYLGEYKRRMDIAVSAPDAIIGDPSTPPFMQPGTFQIVGDFKVIKTVIEVTQER